jgi:tetratricopeptide (TPR) repeat protein
MRIVVLVGWLMLPVAVAAYHYGPGQEQLLLDDAAGNLAAADRHVAAKEYAQAVERFDEALRLLPAGRTQEARRIRLERAKSEMLAKELPKAHEDLKALVEELNADKEADPKLLAEAQTALAGSRYYMTWLMRLEGLSRDLWEPEVEASRQTYRLLAEEAQSKGDEALADERRHDVESAIRLARMDLSELQGLPLPGQ